MRDSLVALRLLCDPPIQFLRLCRSRRTQRPNLFEIDSCKTTDQESTLFRFDSSIKSSVRWPIGSVKASWIRLLVAKEIAPKQVSAQPLRARMPAMPVSFSDRVKVQDDVLISNVQEESVILNLDSERYFGLDDVGTRFLSVLTTSDSIEAAYTKLLSEFDVDRDVLRQDLTALVENLIEQGIVQVSPGSEL
jgi:hypothetical protein